jgi:hypothetical protein
MMRTKTATPYGVIMVMIMIALVGPANGKQAYGDMSPGTISDNDEGWGLRFSYCPTYYNLSLDEVSIPRHPDDAGFLTGNNTVGVGSGFDHGKLSLGIQKTFETNYLEGENWYIKPKLGLDVELSFLKSSQDNVNKEASLYLFQQQTSDTRPPSEGSFVYDRFYTGVFTPIPFVGIDCRVGNWIISPEVGLACKQLNREYGWHRWGREQEMAKISEWLTAIRPALGISYILDNASFGMWTNYEHYDTDFGLVRGFSLGLSIGFRF